MKPTEFPMRDICAQCGSRLDLLCAADADGRSQPQRVTYTCPGCSFENTVEVAGSVLEVRVSPRRGAPVAG